MVINEPESGQRTRGEEKGVKGEEGQRLKQGLLWFRLFFHCISRWGGRRRRLVFRVLCVFSSGILFKSSLLSWLLSWLLLQSPFGWWWKKPPSPPPYFSSSSLLLLLIHEGYSCRRRTLSLDWSRSSCHHLLFTLSLSLNDRRVQEE